MLQLFLIIIRDQLKLNTMSKTITINGVEYAVRPGFKAMIIFEKITDKPFEIKSTTDVLIYIYASILAGSEAANLDLSDMLDAFDEDQQLFTEAMGMVLPGSALDKVVRMANETDGGPEPKKD